MAMVPSATTRHFWAYGGAAGVVVQAQRRGRLELHGTGAGRVAFGRE
jgi:hypothetical protein